MTNFPLTIDHVGVSFGEHRALDDVCFRVPEGKLFGIAGPNGSGKTTLLRAMFGAQALDEGEIRLGDKPIGALRASQIGRQVSVVSQFEHDTDRMRVWDMVLLGRAPHRRDIQGYNDQDRGMAREALVQVGMAAAEKRHLDTLSGGERQRVLIARALAQACPCILLDEPTNHLDVQHQHQVLALLRKVARTAVIILHDLNLVSRYCDEVVILEQGSLVCQGNPREVLTTSVIADTYGVEAIEVFDGDVKQFIFRSGEPSTD